MGRIQSSIGLITGTDIGGTVDQLIALSARPRDRLLARSDLLQREQQAIAELTASVIGVQLAGNQLGNASVFRSKKADSSNPDVLSVVAGNSAAPATHIVRTLHTATTHAIGSRQRHASIDQPLGYVGTMRVHPDGGFLDGSAILADLNNGRGVEPGEIMITDRAGQSARIDLTGVRDINDVIEQINSAEIQVRATTSGSAIKLIDESGAGLSNLRVEQLGSSETAADLGLWGIDAASDSVTGAEIDLPAGTGALRGVSISELNGGAGLGALTDIDITLSDGSTATIDLSSATTTDDIMDAIRDADLSLIVGLNSAGNGFRIRDVSGGGGNLTITSSDGTAGAIGLSISTTDQIVEGENLRRPSVTSDTQLAALNQGAGIGSGSFTVRDSSGAVAAVNLAVQEIATIGDLIDNLNQLGIGITAQLNDAGDGIAIIDTAGGGSTLTIEDTGSGQVAKLLGIDGTATNQVVAGSTVSALVGTQALTIDVVASDTLTDLVAKINEAGRYVEASARTDQGGQFSLQMRSLQGGASGRVGINTSGFDLDFRTDVRGRDALIGLKTDGGIERFLSSSDGVFEIDRSDTPTITTDTPLDQIVGNADRGSFTVTDSSGAIRAINVAADQITTVGEMIDAINDLGIGVTAKLNDQGTGIAVVDSAGGSGSLTIADTGNGIIAERLGINGTATTQTVDGSTVSAVVGPASDSAEGQSGLVLTLKAFSEVPITINVDDNPEAAVNAANAFVDQYNLLVDKLDTLTFYDADTEEVGLLFGSSEALRIRTGYSRLISGQINGAGNLRSVGQIGLRFKDDGKLELDEGKLTEAINTNLTDVEDFFSTKDNGLSDRLNSLADRIAGVENGMLLNRGQTLTSQIEFNNERIEVLNSRLEKERERLLRRFYSVEQAIAKIQSNQAAISQIQPITIPTK